MEEQNEKVKRKKTVTYRMGHGKALNILNMSRENKKEFFESFDMVIIECAGVMWRFENSVLNSAAAVQNLKFAGKQVKFITGDSVFTKNELMERLKTDGVKDIDQCDLIHPLGAIKRYLQRNQPGCTVFSICTDEANSVLKRSGINVVAMKPEIAMKPQELEAKCRTKKVDAVVMDTNFNLTYSDLSRAQQCLLNWKCPLLVGQSSTYAAPCHDLETIGCVNFMNIITEDTEITPIVLAKPSPPAIDDLIRYFGIGNTGHVLFVGCDLQEDILFGIRCGFQVLQITDTEHMGQRKRSLKVQTPKPDYVTNTLADFIDFIEMLNDS